MPLQGFPSDAWLFTPTGLGRDESNYSLVPEAISRAQSRHLSVMTSRCRKLELTTQDLCVIRSTACQGRVDRVSSSRVIRGASLREPHEAIRLLYESWCTFMYN
ncbi:unnamed protein product [Protopolystoma xenopodis]|uniref:Uncharacterized protein n=1 Tax=Protopolystoma xenopodis TaxID=117903 RepID=A0A3S5CS53_9PLAT|nr:unnamed protein product [Protopolystoma xenopodis]